MTGPVDLLAAYEGLVRTFRRIGVADPHKSAIATLANHPGAVAEAKRLVAVS